jgi:8-oxo-dGTP pyrophosphatase MutT (NUDIX family)
VIEAGDGDSPAMIGGGRDRAVRAAAVRECFEECGLIPALKGEVARSARAAVLAGEASFESVLSSAGATVDLSLIHPVSRWITPVGSPRRFDTRFYVAEVELGAEVEVDGVEIVGHRWSTSRDALDAVQRGEIDMIMPTHRTLVRLSAFGSVEEAIAGMPMEDPDSPITTVVESEGGNVVLRIVGDSTLAGDRYDPGTAGVIPT